MSVPETQQETGLVYEYTRPVVKQVGGEEGALKAVPGLPSCAPHPVTKHRIHHFVYFSQLSAYKKGLGETRLSGHSLAALKPLKQPDKTRSPPPAPLGSSKGSGGLPLLSLPFLCLAPAPHPGCCSCTAHWINQVETALRRWQCGVIIKE